MFGRKPTIRVDIIDESGVHPKTCVLDGNRILIQKAKGVKGDPNVYAEYDKDCVVPYRAGLWPFRRLKQKVVWKRGNKKCVSFYGKHVALSHPDVAGFFNAGAIKNAGATLSTIKAPTLLYVAIFAVIFMQVLTLLFATGKVRVV